MSGNEELISTKKALEKLGIKDPRTLKKYAEENNIKRLIFSKKNIKFKLDDINKLIEKKL